MPDPARSRWIERRGRIGFTMSTQRRASRTLPAMKIDRAGLRRRWIISDLTAPLMSIIWLAWAWLSSCDEGSRKTADRHSSNKGISLGTAVMEATNSLLSDRHHETLAEQNSRPGSPPRDWVSVSGLSVLRVSHRSSLRHVPNLLPVRAHLHTTLPIAPAGEVRWAERHDGKRDLYFQHAA